MFELVLQVAQDRVEQASDLLSDALEALSVSVEDADAGSPQEQALFGEPGMPAPGPGWQRSTLRALFEDEESTTQAAAFLLGQPWAADLHLVSIEAVQEQDWVRLTQSQFDPVAVTGDFWIVPTWHQAPVAARRMIRLDPGLAFGTGSHPTTRMCLRWIAHHAPTSPGWSSVLDYGCGSGILAIAAALHGADQVVAVDIDAAAVTATRDNARANGVTLQAGLPVLAEGVHDVVLANILASPLKLLAPLLCGHVAPGGWLVLAGLLDRQAAELIDTYAPYLALDVLDSEDGWSLLAGRRPPA
ncbi:MAG: 50S ribosomal protein L11 methyltransferase [Rubrivivax sp.]